MIHIRALSVTEHSLRNTTKLLLFAEIYILLKLLNMVSSFVVGKMSFVIFFKILVIQ